MIFGPFCGEFGWELTRWCGYVRQECLKNPDKHVIVTRTSRRELYNGAPAKIYTFDIENDYITAMPDCYGIRNYDWKKLEEKVLADYPYQEIRNPVPWGHSKRPIKCLVGDFNFKVEPKILAPLVVAARHRVDNKRRNWNYWEEFYELLKKTGIPYITLGQSSSTWESPIGNCRLDLPLGETMSIIKGANLLIGPQTSLIILSNLLETPTLFWGHQVNRHAAFENPKCTWSKGIEENSNEVYSTDPKDIVKNVQEFFNN